VTGYVLDGRGVGVRFPVRTKYYPPIYPSILRVASSVKIFQQKFLTYFFYFAVLSTYPVYSVLIKGKCKIRSLLNVIKNVMKTIGTASVV
jgi:hypothetical protein